MKKLTPTCFVEKDYAVVKPENSNQWVVLNKNAAVLFKSEKFSLCEKKVKELINET